MDDREVVAREYLNRKYTEDWDDGGNPYHAQQYVEGLDFADTILALLRSRGWADDPLAAPLVKQAKQLRKMCPCCFGQGFQTIRSQDIAYFGDKLHVPCALCHGSRSIPIGPEDVEVKLK